MLVIAILLTGGVFVLYKKFVTKPDGEAAALATPAPAATAIQTEPPPQASPEPQTAAGRLIQKAQETVAAVETGRVAAGNEAAAAATQQAATAAASETPLETIPEPAVAPPEPAPAAVPAPPPPPEASTEVYAFVDKIKVGGYRPGPPARVQLNGVIYKEGDMVEPSLGIVFVGVEKETHNLVFKDGAGALVRRRF